MLAHPTCLTPMTHFLVWRKYMHHYMCDLKEDTCQLVIHVFGGVLDHSTKNNRAVGPAPLVTDLIPGWDFEDQLHGNA